MSREEERRLRSTQEPIMSGLPDVPGINVAMRLTPGLGLHLRGLADDVLVNDFPGASLSRAERELIAEAVSAGNDCYFCMDSHGAHAQALLERSGGAEMLPLVEDLKEGSTARFTPKMQALIDVAQIVRRAPRELTEDHVERARAAGAADADVQLAVLIAAAFSMYNRMVEGFRARTPGAVDAYRERAAQIAELGYSARPAPVAPGRT
jgi:uncharacterized peroxidase-related enzyme